MVFSSSVFSSYESSSLWGGPGGILQEHLRASGSIREHQGRSEADAPSLPAASLEQLPPPETITKVVPGSGFVHFSLRRVVPPHDWANLARTRTPSPRRTLKMLKTPPWDHFSHAFWCRELLQGLRRPGASLGRNSFFETNR